MVSKRIKVIISLIVVVLIAIFVLFTVMKKPELYSKEDIELIIENNLPYMKEILLSENPVFAGCIAYSTDNISVCNVLKGDDEKQTCQNDYCIYTLLSHQCEKIERNQQIMSIKPTSIIAYMEVCRALKSKSCKDLSGEMKKICELLISLNAQDCISFPELNVSKSECKSLVYLYAAISKNDSSYCENIPKFYERNVCISLVSKGECETVLNDIARDWIRFSLSRTLYNHTDISLCDSIKYKEIKKACKDPSIIYEEIIRNSDNLVKLNQ